MAPIATGPTPQRTVERAAATAPMNDEAPPTPATSPRTAGPSFSSSSTNRNQVAPKMPHSAPSDICAPANARSTGSWMTRRKPSRISRSTGSRSSGGRWWRLLTPDAPEQHGRREERDGVDGDGDRRGQDLDEEAADAEGQELRRRSARGEGAVGIDELVALDDRRQVGVVGGVEERREEGRRGRRRPASCQYVRTPRANATGTDPSRTARPRSAQMSTGRRRRRSTHAPATSPNTSAAPSSRPRRTAISRAPEPRTRIAASGRAIRVTSDPKIEIVAADQTRTNAELRPER